jgi:hypothetical protein
MPDHVPVVRGHVTHLRTQPYRLAAGDERHARLPQLLRDRIARVAGHQQHRVDVPGGDVPRDAPPFVLGARQHQQQRDVVRGQRLGATAQQGVEVGVLEEPLLRLRQQEATESERPVINDRACRFTTYPVLRMAALTASAAAGLA